MTLVQATDSRLVPGNGSRVLLLSMRAIENLVAYSMTYEFEDVITELTGADRVDVGGSSALELSRRAYKAIRFTTGSRRLARSLMPQPSVVHLNHDYDLFLPTFNHAWELFALAAVPDWRKRCRVAACFVSELWLKELPRYLLELLADFDHIFLGVWTPVEEVARISGRPCTFLPLAADVLRFTPLPELRPRFIDVCNIGRRSVVTHEALLALARERRICYHYDTVVASGIGAKQRTFEVEKPAEHRLLLASTLQRTRYYFAHRARVNQPELTQGHDEISGRFYEGAAAGTVMLGEPPDCEPFQRLFDWTDALIPVPFDAPDIAQRLAELDRDPLRLARIARTNAQQAAARHDWLHRLQTIYATLGLPATEAMLARATKLQTLATSGLDRAGGRAA